MISYEKAINELLDLTNEYLELTLAELKEIVPIAHAHGWESSRFEEGNRIRSKIDGLRAKVREGKVHP